MQLTFEKIKRKSHKNEFEWVEYLYENKLFICNNNDEELLLECMLITFFAESCDEFISFICLYKIQRIRVFGPFVVYFLTTQLSFWMTLNSTRRDWWQKKTSNKSYQKHHLLYFRGLFTFVYYPCYSITLLFFPLYLLRMHACTSRQHFIPFMFVWTLFFPHI